MEKAKEIGTVSASIGVEVPQRIGVDEFTSKNADALVFVPSRVAGVFQSQVNVLEEEAMLWIHVGRFLGSVSEESGIKLFRLVQDGGDAHVPLIVEQIGWDTRSTKIIVAQKSGRFR